MYNPFERKKKQDYSSLFPALNTAYTAGKQTSQPTGGIYDQFGTQIGSSPTKQTTTVPVASYDRKTKTSIPQPNQTTPTPSVPNYVTNYKDLADRKRSQAEESRNRQNQYYTNAFAEKNKTLSESIPRLQNQFNQTEGYFKKGLETAGKRAEIAKQGIVDETGRMQREAAQTRKESAARTAGRFAGLNTTDSFGFGSHGRAQENIESDFNKFTQENLRNQQNQKFEIDSALQDYEIDAQQKIDSAKMNLENVIAKIQSDMRMNDIEKQNALQGVLSDYNDVLNGIDAEMNGVYENYYNKLSELEKTSLSEEFMTTGQPQNENDFRFMYANPDQYADIIGGSKANELDDKGKTAASGLDVLTDIRGYLSSNPGIYRDINPLTNRDYKSSIINMSDIIGRLRSGGAINPDEEERFLDLLPSFWDDQVTVLKKLSQLENELNIRTGGSYSPTGTYGSGQRLVNVVSPNGEVGSIDESELKEAMNNGWRRA